MSDGNVELARRSLEAFNRGDRDAWFVLHDPELEFHADPDWPEGGFLRGREAVWDFLVRLNDAWEPSDGEIVDVIDPGGDKFAVRVRRPVVGKVSGIPDALDQWCAFTIHGGKLSRYEWSVSRANAVKALGLTEQAMSEENVKIVRGMYAAYLAGDVERALSYFHPDVEADFTVRGDTRPTRGREALGETVGAWVSTFDNYSEEIEDIRGVGDAVCVIATQRGRGKGSGVEVGTRFGQLYTVEARLITSVTMYTAPAEALKAAGLSG